MRSLRSLVGSSKRSNQATRPDAPGVPHNCVGLSAEYGDGDIPAAGKAGRLITSVAMGLDVPAGFVIPDGAAIPSVDDTRRWADDVGAGSLAVRSAFSAEDGADSSLAGWFHTELRVAVDDIVNAAERVRASVARLEAHGSVDAATVRRDVLVMKMVDARHAGVAFTEPGTYDDVVNVATGTAERLVGGEEEGESMQLARLETEPDGWRRRLQVLLRSVRARHGDMPWDIEWADDGTTCWLVQIRPITSPTRRNDALTIANHAEILPPLPSHLMTSAIERSGDELFGWYRNHDKSLPDNRPFLEVVAGRPFINLTLLEDLLRHLGLPTKLVADSIGGPPDNDRPAAPARVLRKSPVLIKMGLAQITAVVRAKRNQRRLASMGYPQASTFGEALTQLDRAYVGLVTGMFPLSSAIGPPLAILRRAGTLVEHAGRHRTVTSELAEALDDVRSGSMPLRAFLEQFGHRGVYESDIARPRFRDLPQLLGTAGVESSTSEQPALSDGVPSALGDASTTRKRRTIKGVLTAPVWAAAKRPLAAREELRDQAMVGFAAIRSSLVALAQLAAADGRLRTVDDLWLLSVDEAAALDDGWIPAESFWSAREAERAQLAALDPPPVVHRFDDPAMWRHDAPIGDRIVGLPLTDGVVRGQAWVLREPSVDLPDGFDAASTVLIARSVDAGWIPTFQLVAGVVVETGGDLSHGSILLRERGIPAVTNVRGATRFVETGDEVEVRVGAGVVERIAPSAAT